MALSKRLRFEVLRRDNHTCQYCGATAPSVPLTVDHVVPVSLGGADEPTNLVAACVDCNSGKSSSSPDQPLVDKVSADALAWASALVEAADVLAHERTFADQYVQEFKAAAKARFMRLPPGAESTVENFYTAGLPLRDVLDAVDVAAGASTVEPANRFRYFCGVCWKRLSRIQEIAKFIYDVNQASEPE